jgi:DNA-binding LytR/AlgR family response regulator
MKLHVLVVDDEPPARRRLAAMLARTGRTETIREAVNADEAAAILAGHRLDVVFLDVRMPGKSGLELARGLGARPVVVFTTAYSEHAVEAFDTAAADYLLKPVAATKLARALDRAANRLADATDYEPRITARTGALVRVFPAIAIARFTTADKYTAFWIDGTEHLIDEPLGTLEHLLGPWGFVRVHRAELVQLARIRALHRRRLTAELVLDDGQRARVSRRLLPALRKHLRARRG